MGTMTAHDLLARFAAHSGLTMEQVRVIRLARRERSAALLRRVVMGLVREREQLRRQLAYELERNEALGKLVRGKNGRAS